MGALSDIISKLGDIPTVAVLRERVAFAAEQAKTLEKKVEDLERENAALKQENTRLNAELAAKTREEQFVEHRGALFKRKPEGGYHLAVYCPRCHSSTSSLHGAPYACTEQCWWIGEFSQRELAKVISELPP
jgi:regulator of replication initiation timing